MGLTAKKPLLRTVVGVKFDHGHSKEYHYLTDIEFAEEDKAVVNVDGEFKVVTVTSHRGFSKYEINKASKWIVQKLDLEAYYERLKKQAIAQDIKNKLQEYKEKMEEYMIYKQLAKDDPDIKDLLVELAEVDSSYKYLLTDNSEEK